MLSKLPGYLSFLFILGVPSLIFLLIPDLGTLMVLVPLAFIMMRYGGGKLKHLV